MNIFKYIKCLLFGHDISGSESIVETYCSNNWLKKCNCCGRYIMNGDIGNVCLSEKEALKIKREFDELWSLKRIARLKKETQETSTMGIEIDGLSLPKSCFKCFAAHWYDYGGVAGYQCRAIPMDIKIIPNCEARTKRRDDCPLKMKF